VIGIVAASWVGSAGISLKFVFDGAADPTGEGAVVIAGAATHPGAFDRHRLAALVGRGLVLEVGSGSFR
jgi:hypothetical protein